MPGSGSVEGRKALLAWREKNGVSRQRMAELLGLRDPASVWQYEHGKLPFALIHLISLQRITGIPVWTLASPEQRQIIRGLWKACPPEVFTRLQEMPA